MIKFLSAGIALAIVIAGGLLISMSEETIPVAGQLAAAVAKRNLDEVGRLLIAGANPDDQDHRGEEAILIATITDQFRIANMLADYGANIWATHKFGFTPGNNADFSNVISDSVEGSARARFIERLRAAGYPWPPPGPDAVMALYAAGQWPPPGAKDAQGRPLRSQ